MEGFCHVTQGVDEEQGYDAGPPSGRVEGIPGGTRPGTVGRPSEKEAV